MLGRLRRDTQIIQQAITDLVIYSSGAISWTEAWLISPSERDGLVKTLNTYLQKKAGKTPDEYL